MTTNWRSKSTLQMLKIKKNQKKYQMYLVLRKPLYNKANYQNFTHSDHIWTLSEAFSSYLHLIPWPLSLKTARSNYGVWRTWQKSTNLQAVMLSLIWLCADIQHHYYPSLGQIKPQILHTTDWYSLQELKDQLDCGTCQLFVKSTSMVTLLMAKTIALECGLTLPTPQTKRLSGISSTIHFLITSFQWVLISLYLFGIALI